MNISKTRINPPAPPSSPEIQLLLAFIDQGFHKVSWHGPTLRGSLRGVSVKDASFRPAPNRHNIWEHVVHAAYWKYIVRRRILGEQRGSFPITGSNWILRPQPQRGLHDERAWRADVKMLEDMHAGLREAVAAQSPKTLHRPLRGVRNPRITPAWLITGVAMHDIYHAGQIGLLKRLARAR